jgi:hypothetical protein
MCTVISNKKWRINNSSALKTLNMANSRIFIKYRIFSFSQALPPSVLVDAVTDTRFEVPKSRVTEDSGTLRCYAVTNDKYLPTFRKIFRFQFQCSAVLQSLLF